MPKTTIRRANFWPATVARRLRKSSWMLRVAAASSTRRRNDPAGEHFCLFATAHGRNDAALLVSAALVVAAAARSRVLADGANDHVGLPAILHHAECRLLCARRRHVHRRGAAVGSSVS